MTGIKTYKAIKEIAACDAQKVVPIHPADAADLMKLRASDLESLGYEQELAEKISTDLLGGNLNRLAKSLMINLRVDKNASRLTEPGNCQDNSGGEDNLS
ncbi:MAG: hypothetical protein WC058_09030 [Phycisphaeraceae bacterium]